MVSRLGPVAVQPRSPPQHSGAEVGCCHSISHYKTIYVKYTQGIVVLFSSRRAPRASRGTAGWVQTQIYSCVHANSIRKSYMGNTLQVLPNFFTNPILRYPNPVVRPREGGYGVTTDNVPTYTKIYDKKIHKSCINKINRNFFHTICSATAVCR